MATSQGSNSADLKVILELADKTQGQLEKKKALSANDRTTLKNSRSILNQFIDKDILKLSTNEFKTLQKNLKILNDIIIKASKSLGSTSPELARLQKTLETKRGSLTSEKNKIKTSSTNVTLKSILDGSFDSKQVSFTAKYLEEKLRQAGLKRPNGQMVKGLETYQKIMLSEGAAGFSNSKTAQNFYDKYGLTGETGTAVEKMRAAVRETANNITTLIKEVKAAEKEVSAAAKGENPVLDQGYKIQNLSDEYLGKGEVKQDEITKTSSKIATLNANIQKTQSYLAKAAKQFTVYALVIRSVRRALNEAITTITDLDKSLTEQAMVTGMSRDQAYELVGAYQELALEVGATTKEIAEVATEYMKQGQTIQDSLTLTKAAVAAAKVARVDVGDSVNYLTTALNGFQLSAEQAMEVSDKFAAVAAASASDYDELAIALSKVASQANLAGMSMDYTIALLTKGLETTREAPETMGTALKTIIARMRELTDYGATLEDGTNINTVESQLAYVGISLRDNNGELRSTEEVLDELGKKWDTLNTNQQAALAKALAGTRWRMRLWRVQGSALKNYPSKSPWIVGTTLKTSLLTINGNI